MNKQRQLSITQNNLASSKRLLFFLILLLLSACSVQRPIQSEELGQLGYFEFREPRDGMEGVIIGAPHGVVDPDSATLAKQISDRTGAGFVVAYGFDAKQLAVSQPIVRAVHAPKTPDDPIGRGSVFREFKKILHRTAGGEIDFYVGIHSGIPRGGVAGIEATSSGLTFEETKILKESFTRLRDQWIGTKTIAKLAMAIDPLDRISWRAAGIRNHGVLMTAEKGLSLRLTGETLSKLEREAYAEILSSWVAEAVRIVRDNPQSAPQIEVKLLDLGRFEVIQSRKGLAGIVIGSPHGSFDQNTAETAIQLAYRTGLAAVIARGFTPTETGGWRINVNRPTERAYPPTEFELRSERARKVFEAYRGLVMEASKGDLNLYFDIHRYSRNNTIQVATVGVWLDEARKIKAAYREIRDDALRRHPNLKAVELVIEPLDQIDIGAWDAKAHGILGMARRSLHFELPSDGVLGARTSHEVYTQILGDLLKRAVVILGDAK